MTGSELLQWSANILKDHQVENPRLNAELLFAHSLNLNREGLYVRLHRAVKEKEKRALERLIQKKGLGGTSSVHFRPSGILVDQF